MAQFFNFQGDYFGLTEADIDKNIEMYGLNVYTKDDSKQKPFSPARVLLSPQFLLMLIAGVLSLFTPGWGAGIAIVLIDALYAAAEIYVNTAADARLSEIKASTAMKFRVIRGGKLELIDKEFIVPEDIIVVQAGERVPADAYIQEARDLTADESIFTGSNKPAAKYQGAISKSELKPTFVYSGTKILTGVAICKVSATGEDTRYHHTIGAARDEHKYYTQLERAVQRIVPMCSAIAALLALFSLIFWTVTGSPSVDAALRGITLGLCFIPAGIATVIRIYYIKGASDMISRCAVVKSLCDIERLNSLSVLCVEKQGAISKSRLEVKSIYARSEELLYKIAALACDPATTDEAERALMVKAGFFDENIADIYSQNTFIEKIPDTNEVMSGALWEVNGSRLYCIKGTPEQILPLCRFKGDALFNVQKKQQEYYSSGCQVMAVACADADERDCDSTAGFAYTFVGFAAFSAPLRSSVSSAVKTCKRAGVKVVMFTEDNPKSAAATGKMIGLSGKTVTGSEISSSVKYGSELDLDADIYAKVTPEQKLYIIDKLKKRGDVVAMTGTRTVDAEALEMADVGITISQYTAGSAYEAADIIMNDDNFASIADMLASARQIHRNIKRAVSVMISGYIALIILTAMNLFVNAQLMLNPSLIAAVTMIMLPAAALTFFSNRGDSNGSMPPSEFVSHNTINYMFLGRSALYGLLCGAVAFASYMFMYSVSNVDFARSCAFISLGICMALFSFISISGGNPVKTASAVKRGAAVCIAVQALLPILLVFLPAVNSAFGLAAVDMLAMFISVVTGIIPAAGYIIIKTLVRFN